MWYEILPTMAILAGCSFAIPICAYCCNILVQSGNPYRRDIRKHPFDQGLLLRDIYLFKKPYKIQGLKNIPDEEVPPVASTDEKKGSCPVKKESSNT